MKAFILALAALAPLAHAGDLFTRVEPVPLKEFWVDSGFATYHFKSDVELSGRNPGIGVEYRFRADIAATAGRFLNSDGELSNYLGAIWQPVAIGPVRLGAVVAAFNGYPHVREAGWFPALIPVATVEYKRVGVNIGFVPTLQDRLHGGISVQLKFKLAE